MHKANDRICNTKAACAALCIALFVMNRPMAMLLGWRLSGYQIIESFDKHHTLTVKLTSDLPQVEAPSFDAVRRLCNSLFVVDNNHEIPYGGDDATQATVIMAASNSRFNMSGAEHTKLQIYICSDRCFPGRCRCMRPGTKRSG